MFHHHLTLFDFLCDEKEFCLDVFVLLAAGHLSIVFEEYHALVVLDQAYLFCFNTFALHEI